MLSSLRLRQASVWVVHFWAALSVLLLTVLSVTLEALLGAIVPIPMLGLAALLHWSYATERRFTLVVLLVLGLLSDALYGAPLGFHVLLYLLLCGCLSFLASQVRFSRFTSLWFIVAVTTFLVAWLVWLVASLLTASLVPFSQLTVQIALTLAIYPWVASLLALTVTVSEEG